MPYLSLGYKINFNKKFKRIFSNASCLNNVTSNLYEFQTTLNWIGISVPSLNDLMIEFVVIIIIIIFFK